MPPLRQARRFFASAQFLPLVVLAWGWLPVKLGAQTASADDAWLAPLPDFANPVPGATLSPGEAQFDQLLSLAATNSPLMREQKDAVDQVDAARFRSWLRHMPVISASYSVGAYYQTSSAGSSGSSLTPGGSFTLQASEPLFHWGAFDAQTDLGILREQIAQNDAILAYAKLCLDLRQRYYQLIVNQAAATTLDHDVDSAKDQLDKAHLMLAQGTTTAAHVRDLELKWNSLQIKRDKAAEDFDAQLAEFRRLTGSSSFAAADVPDHIVVPVLDQSNLRQELAEYQKSGVNLSPAAREANLNETALDRQITISNATRKPMFDLTASISQAPYINAANNGLKFGTIFFVGVSGSWSLFDRGDSLAATEALYAQKRLTETQFADSRQQAANDATHSLHLIGLGLQAIAVLKNQYEQQQNDYRRVQLLVSTGQAERTQVNDARDALLDTREQLLSRQADVAGAYYSFLSDIFQDPALANAPPFTQPR